MLIIPNGRQAVNIKGKIKFFEDFSHRSRDLIFRNLFASKIRKVGTLIKELQQWGFVIKPGTTNHIVNIVAIKPIGSSEKDEVIGMITINESETDVLVVSENGYGKRSSLEDYRITNRGGKGVKTINVTEKTGKLVAILDVTEKEDLIITCQSGITLRTPIANIKTAGRNTQGVTLIRLDSDDAIAAISKIEEEPIEELIEAIIVDENVGTTENADGNITEAEPESESPESTEEQTD